MEITPNNETSLKKYCCERMAIKKEFIKILYAVLSQSALDSKDLTHLQAFNLLNELYILQRKLMSEVAGNKFFNH